MAKAIEIETPHGPARAHLHPASDARAALVLGPGAGGGVEAPDLVTATEVAVDAGVSVALVEQPYRVAGKRSQPAASTIDAAWTVALSELREGELTGLPLVAGGRSAGARVACRCAAETGAAGVLCLAFPLIPPQRKDGTRGPSRLPELEAVGVPVLVVQGASDRFGMPEPAPGREVVQVRGNHSLRSDQEAIAEAIRGWLPGVAEGAAVV